MAEQKRISTRVKKASMLKALKQTLGVVTPAAERSRITRQEHYNWMKSDPVYREAVEDMDDIGLDFTESKMFKGIQDGDASLIKYHLSTKGRKRGYAQRQEVTGADGEPLVPPSPNGDSIVVTGEKAMEVYLKLMRGDEEK